MLCRYGTAATKAQVVRRVRDPETLRSLVCLASQITENRWYPSNVGTNLLLIAEDMFELIDSVSGRCNVWLSLSSSEATQMCR